MDKQSIYQYLSDRNIPFESTEHGAVYNMAELDDISVPHPEDTAKNLFVRDDKKRSYYLITVKGTKRVDLKEFKQKHQTRTLSFASEQDLSSLLGLFPGAVTPLGLLNDSEHRVQLFLDREFLSGSGYIGVHPNDNTASVRLKTEDLIRLLREHGSTVHVEEI